MWTTYYMNKFSLLTDIGYREGCIKQLGDGTSGLIIIHTRHRFGVITNFCCRYISPQNMPIHSIQTIWVSNALLHINMDILPPWVAKMQSPTTLLSIPGESRGTGLRRNEWASGWGLRPPYNSSWAWGDQDSTGDGFRPSQGWRRGAWEAETAELLAWDAHPGSMETCSHQKQSADLDKLATHRREEAVTETLRETLERTQRHRDREVGRRKERQGQSQKGRLRKGARRPGDRASPLCLHCAAAFSAANGILGTQPRRCVSRSISLTGRLYPPTQNHRKKELKAPSENPF